MRDVLTYIGIALIALLTAAFAAPFAVDFDAYRGRVGEELAAIIGAQVALDGPIDLRLLPTPRFSAQNLSVSGDLGALRARTALFELSFPALIQGKLQFSTARLDGADITLAVDKIRSLGKDLGPGGAGAQIDNFTLHDARLTLVQPGAPPLRLDIADLSAKASSLAGPFQGHGALTLSGKKVTFSLGSDVLAKSQLPLKVSAAWPGETGRLDLDGRVTFSTAPAWSGQLDVEGKAMLAAAPTFQGQAKAAGQVAAGPWQAESELVARLDGVDGETLSARLGDGPLADKLQGKARYEPQTGEIALDLAAPHLGEPWVEALAAPLLAASASKAPLDLHLAADSLDWRGVSWTQARYDRKSGAPARVQAQGPGDSALDLAVATDKTDKDVWRGKGEFKAQDFAALAAALPFAAPLADLKLRAVDLTGDVSLSPGAVAVTGANLRLDRARLTGDLIFKPEKAGSRPFLAARLTAPALDLDAAPEFSGGFFPDVDLDLSLDAQTVKLARSGVAYGEGGKIKAHLLRKDDATTLEKLELRNIGGADLTASGGWDRDFSSMKGEARLKAADVSGLAQALARVAPGAATRLLASRGKLLSPADLLAKAGEKGFELSGALGGTKISASLTPLADGGRSAAFELSAPEGGVLLNQLGASLLLTQKYGPAHVTAQAQPEGGKAAKLNLTAIADVAGLHGAFHGNLQDLAGDPLKAPSIDGDLALSGDMAKVFAGLLSGPQPARLTARLVGKPGELKAQNFAGEWGGSKISGDLTFGAEGVGGRLSCDRLSAPALLALVLGPPAPVRKGALWSSLSFAPVITDPPRAKLAVEAEDFRPFGASAQFDLALGPGFLSLSHAKFEAIGLVLRGGLDLRRDGARVTIEGDAEGSDIALKDPALSGKLSGKLHFAGNGANAAALIGSLAGSGSAQSHDLAIEGAAAEGLNEALAASEAADAPFDAAQVAKTLDQGFSRGAFHVAEADFSLRLAEGRMAFTREKDEGAALDASFDLRDANLALTLTLAAQKTPPNWTAPLPHAGVTWAGPWRAPVRRVEATAFVSAVAARALEREQAQIEAQKAQDRERLRALTATPIPPAHP